MEFLNGGPNWTRTSDPYLVEVVLYQLSYETIKQSKSRIIRVVRLKTS